jgi:hypothetical protein
MLSTLLFVVSLVNHSGFVDSNLKSQLKGEELSGGTSGGLVVKMGPVMNVRVADVRVIPGRVEFPALVQKGSLFEGFSRSRLVAVHYGK